MGSLQEDGTVRQRRLALAEPPSKGRFSEVVDVVATAEATRRDGAMMTTGADITHLIRG
jgi:hypothetical protein